ncbi:hypothetical protein [Dysgonomonas macrotermitis]|uniref:Uncharacterized protein n=1 Tax=Dysgonomonas macrotermitis TaxID=1346286 RepID=A0A1M5FIN6_9BACT|nr:hypothetical protein [Dysgonomonas macrotermitis]SHF91410.1 hypothetical protein SAMN05444362_11211 [Dysgonomonas macrotermitis]
MKTLTIIITILTLFTSCSATYFYSTINTNDPYTYKDEYGRFVQEGDSIDVLYSFYGENAPITICVVNKMSIPIYIDWRRSGVVIDDTPSPFAPNFDSEYDQDDLINFNLYMNNPDGLSYIRPYSRYEQKVMELANFNFHQIPDEQFVKRETEADSNGENRLLNSLQYTEADSPLFMKTYLSIYEESSYISDPLIYESDFYISELIKGKKSTKPDSFQNGQGDIFLVKHKKEKRLKKIGEGTLKVAGVTATVIGNIAIWALNSSGEH